MTTPSFFWHDYETFGIDPRYDRICQFAGIRSDHEFNIIGPPISIFCKPSADYLPQPEACLLTGITPQYASENGVCEAEFAALIHQQLVVPGTCTLGYNSLRFDDEFTRNLFYRNFYDPYAREWQNQNSRWDLIDIVRCAYALRPDGINWPLNAEGVVSFRLEELTQANGIQHLAAHEALSDVYATLSVAKLISERQPKLFRFLFEHRLKSTIQDLLQLGTHLPLIHVSGRYPSKKYCLAVVLPICLHPINANEVVVYDLSVDPQPLLDLSPEEIRSRLFTANQDLPENQERIALKTIHINKCPVLAPMSVIREKDTLRLELDLGRCEKHRQRLIAANDLTVKLQQVFNRDYPDSGSDPDLMIYSGGFFSNRDKAVMQKIRSTNPDELVDLNLDYDDIRIPEMLFRYRARNFPDTLSSDEAETWRLFCRQRLVDCSTEKRLNLQDYFDKIAQFKTEVGSQQQTLISLEAYGRQLRDQLVSG
jgi:exodeoxyribonuclease I